MLMVAGQIESNIGQNVDKLCRFKALIKCFGVDGSLATLTMLNAWGG